MQLCIRRLACLAVLVGILAAQTTLSVPIKVTNCCTKVSTMNVTAQIIGYKIQRKNLPCVRAVIFQTTDGEVCSHWREDWVFEKIKQLEQIRRANRITPATTTSSS
ncbi:CC chemokine [Solea senegalensis]|uniref:CC chemokine n=1 Tax=Solea senegalensis TaxID=28829 RepID=A0AAV6T895_SOLSE|nr:CC chemokine [Solea senegalensis]